TIVEYYPITTVPNALQGWAFHLIQSNTKKYYENSRIGWNPSNKVKELCESGARYLIARKVHTINNNVIIGNPIGFVMFQFTFEETMADDNRKIETIYWYINF
ncbi:17080_t:CDS:2, partial [Cetraspora pellucida]